MLQRTKVSLATLIALEGLLAASIAQAQTVERIEITGSLIRRIDGESALPVTNLRSEELQRAGATNAESIVKFITQQQGGTVTTGSVSGTNGAAAYADLRSLGANRTLVLLNGRRIVPNPFASAAVDLNLMPVGAVERVETLSDGASSTYGTDAIAGVVNFITRKSYRGVRLGVAAQVPEEGGAEVYTADILGGLGDLSSDGWNVYGAFNYRDQKPMLGTERAFMRTSFIPSRGFNGLSPTTFPANYSQGSIIGNPSLSSGCQPPTSLAAPQVNNVQCFADTQAFTQVYPIQEQWGAFVKGSLVLGGSHTASIEYFKAFNKVSTQIAPSPEGGLTLFPTSPFYPGRSAAIPAPTGLNAALPVSVSWRTTLLGARRGVQENDTQRAVASIEGVLADWDYSAGLLWSNSMVTNNFLNGYPATQALRNGVSGCAGPLVLVSGGQTCPAGPLVVGGTPIFLNPFGDQTSAGLNYLQANTVNGRVQEGEGTLQSASATLSRSFGALPGGAIGFAVTGEYREEEMVYRTNIPLVSQAASSGLAGSGAIREGKRDVTAVGMEVSLPITKTFELGLSVRHDRYSDFGETTNPKVSLRFKPTEQLLLRASANTGFSAPTLTSLYAPNSTTFTANRFSDPLLCPGGVPNTAGGAVVSRDCGIQFQRLIGGFPNLKAEESTAWTVGFVFEPIRSLTVGVDFFNYHLKRTVSTLGEQTIFLDPVKYANLYVRCSQAPADRRSAIGACQIPGGDPLAYIIDLNENLGDIKTEGVDVSMAWNSGATQTGRWGATVRGTYVTKYHFQTEQNGIFFTPVGNYRPQFGGPVIRYQQVSAVTWDNDAFSVRLGNRFQSGYRDQNAQGAPFNVAPFNTNEVKAYSLWDLSAVYRGIKGVTLSVGVQNLLDEDPPFTNQSGRFQSRAYDDRFHDPRGRTYQVSARYEF